MDDLNKRKPIIEEETLLTRVIDALRFTRTFTIQTTLHEEQISQVLNTIICRDTKNRTYSLTMPHPRRFKLMACKGTETREIITATIYSDPNLTITRIVGKVTMHTANVALSYALLVSVLVLAWVLHGEFSFDPPFIKGVYALCGVGVLMFFYMGPVASRNGLLNWLRQEIRQAEQK